MAGRILLVDDEEEICTLLSVYLKNENFEVVTFSTGKEALDYLEDHEVDLAVLDVMLPDMDGLEVAKKIRRKLSDSILIYVTHYIDFSIEGYEVNAYRYILKTQLEEKLPMAYASLEAALRRKKQPDRYYLVERYGKQEKIFYRDIYYLKKDRKYVVIVHKDGESPVRKSISALLEGFYGKEFLMIDRSYVVNINQVESLKDYEVHIRNGEILPVSRPKWKSVCEMIMNNGE